MESKPEPFEVCKPTGISGLLQMLTAHAVGFGQGLLTTNADQSTQSFAAGSHLSIQLEK